MIEETPTFRLITRVEQLTELAPAWRDLLADSGQAGPMLEPTWLLTWWTHYCHGRSLACGIFEVDGRLVGLAPFCIRTHVYRGVLRYRRIEFLGSTADEPDALCSEYLDLIVRRGWEDIVAADCARALLAGEFGAWDECMLEAMNEAPVGGSVMQALGRSGARIEIEPGACAPYVRLPADWDTYLARLSSQQRRYIKSTMRHFESWSATTGYEVHRAIDTASLHTGMTILARLHAERWRKDGQLGVFAASRFLAFHSDYAGQALALGQLDLVWVTVSGEPIMAHYNLVGRDKIYFYQSGRKVDLPKSVRPGIVMHILVLQHAIANGFREYDFLGDDSTYKRLLATHSRTLLTGRVARPTATEYVLQSVKHAMRSMRRFRAQLSPFARPQSAFARLKPPAGSS